MFSGSQMGTKLVGPYLANTLGGPLLRRGSAKEALELTETDGCANCVHDPIF